MNSIDFIKNDIGNDDQGGATASAPLPALTKSYQALQATLQELRALADEDLLRVNVDIPRACTVVLAAVPAIQALRPLIERLPGHDVGAVDNLERYAVAAYCAHLQVTQSRDPAVAREVAQRAMPVRTTLLVQAQALAQLGAIAPGSALGMLPSGTGYLDVAYDLVTLARVLRQSWSTIAGKAPFGLADVDRADELGRELLAAIGAREAPNVEVLDQRTRAFTLLVRAYDTCRRAVAYLRWAEGDVDTIVPSLFKRSPRRAAGATDGATAPAGDAGETAPAPPTGGDEPAPPIVTPPAATDVE